MSRIWRDIPVSLRPEDVLHPLHRGSLRATPPALMVAATEAVAMGQRLIAPAAVYRELVVREVIDGQVILSAENGGEQHCLSIGLQADLLAPARHLVVAVCTIGLALERRVRELHEAGKSLLSFLLDTVGVLALDAAGRALYKRVEERAAGSNRGVSPVLSPGSLAGWPVEGQRELCALVPLDEIGVRLNEYHVLEPHKSVSAVVGMGPGYDSPHVGSMCSCCSLADSCWQRREE